MAPIIPASSPRILRQLAGVLIVSLCLAACGKPSGDISVIPMPAEVEIYKGEFNFANASFSYDSSMDEASLDYARAFEASLRSVTGSETKGCAKVKFVLDDQLAAEEYTIKSTPRRLTVKASSLNGFVYAVQTIKQLLPVAIWSGEADPDAQWSVPVMNIRDYPRFAYRGMHFDCVRHFFTVDEVRRYIDLLEMHKINRFHWHLTDDQGWRIEIKSHPEITAKGGWRNGTMIGRDFSSNDGIRYGGFYTQEELRSVVDYAAARGITIIPEIELPGHTQAIITAYPKLGCTGGPYEVMTVWGISDEVICAGNDDVFPVIEDILTELMDIFPSEYIHIGGDECPKVSWEACPKCQAKIRELGLKDDDKFKAEDYLQSYVMNRVEKFLNEHGRKVIGWDEILDGDISQTATIMSWRGSSGGIKAAQSGRDAIMVPNDYFYFDYCQSRNRAAEPLCIGGYVPVNKVYSFEPFEKLSEEESKHILGVQANLWTEYISEFSGVEYMVLPRMDALCEVQWCAADRKDFERFRHSLLNMRKIYDALGARYATHIFDGRLDEEMENN